MVPITLHLQNFLSYGDPPTTIPFSAITQQAGGPIICISGNTGHGKTAILEGISWALWGESRKVKGDKRAGVRVIHRGQLKCQVQLDFMLPQLPDTVFTVSRRITRPRLSSDRYTQGLLFRRNDKGEIVDLTGRTDTGTQETINNVIRLSYPTFCSSSYIHQKNSGLFLESTPGQRMSVLSDILDLSIYEELYQLAKKERDHFRTEEIRMRTIRERNVDEFERGKTRLRELETLPARVKEVITKITQTKGFIQHHEEEHQRFLALHRQEHELSKIITGLDARSDIARDHLQTHSRIYAEAENLYEHKEHIATIHTEHTDNKQQLIVLTALRDEARRHIKTKEALESDFEQERARLQAVNQERLQQITVLEEKKQRAYATIQEHARQQRILEEVLAREPELLQSIEVAVQHVAHVTELREIEVIKKAEAAHTMVEVTERLSLLTGKETECPVCHKGLAEEERQAIQTNYQKQAEVLKGIITAADNRMAELEQEFTQILAEQAEQETVKQRIAAARLDHEKHSTQQSLAEEELKQLSEELVRVDALVEQTSHRLLTNAFAETTQRQIQAAIQRIPEYDEEHLCALTTRQHAIEEDTLFGQRQAVEQAEKTMTDMQKLIDSDQQDIEQLTREKESAGEELLTIKGQLSEMDEERILNDIQMFAETLNDLEEEQGELYKQVGEQNALEIKQHEREREYAKIQQDLQNVSTLGEDYARLCEVYAPMGIQSWLVTSALPDLERTTNKLLSRLLHGFQVEFITDTATKKGDHRKTLLIFVNGEPFEIFSGGEQFRINFAIRVGLSKLLAHRASVPLRFIAIDEGLFSSQDAVGQQIVLEMIREISDEFSLILLISHNEQVKQTFPTRIEVFKSEAEGSTISISY